MLLLKYPKMFIGYFFRLKMADLKEAYIAALEKKLAELSGIEVDQIKKNQVFTINILIIEEISYFIPSITHIIAYN